MKTKLIILILVTLGVLKVTAQQKHTLTIEFVGLKSNKGKVYVGVHDNAQDFLKKRINEATLEIKNKKCSVSFELATGEYAISAFHDANNNQELDTNFLGIPKEAIGISNDATGFMGPPKYKDAKFNITDNKTITITIK